MKLSFSKFLAGLARQSPRRSTGNDSSGGTASSATWVLLISLISNARKVLSFQGDQKWQKCLRCRAIKHSNECIHLNVIVVDWPAPIQKKCDWHVLALVVKMCRLSIVFVSGYVGVECVKDTRLTSFRWNLPIYEFSCYCLLLQNYNTTSCQLFFLSVNGLFS